MQLRYVVIPDVTKSRSAERGDRLVATLLTALVIIALSWAAPSWAQEMPVVHKVGLSVYVASAALDFHSTYQVLSGPGGGIEHNPLGLMTAHDPLATVAVGASVDAVATTLLYKWLGKEHPKLTAVLLFGVSSLRLSLAAHNYGEARRARE